MKTRLNKHNRPVLAKEAWKQLSKRAKANGSNWISIIDMWEVMDSLEKKFNISETASEKIVYDVCRQNQKQEVTT